MPEALPGLWICGNSLVELFPPDPGAWGDAEWRWDSRSAQDLPEERRRWFAEADEVKPARLDGGTEVVLVTASYEGGVAVIGRASREVLFSGSCTNAHSVEILPGGLVAAAGSGGTDQMQLWRLSDGPGAEEPAARAPFPSAHSAVWEPGAERLWASGRNVAGIFRVETSAGAPRIEMDREIGLPESGAHDMLPDPHSGGLVLSTSRRCWRLDPESLEVAPFEPLAEAADVKAISVERSSGVVAFQRGEHGHWWSENVYLLAPDGRLGIRTLPGRRVYKARWDQPCWLAR